MTAKGRFNGCCSCYFITQSKHSFSPLRRPLLWSRRRYVYIQLLSSMKFIRTPRSLHSLIQKRLPTCALNLSIIFSFKAFILTSWKTSFSPLMLFFSLLYLAGFKLTLYLIKLYAHFIKVRYNIKPLRGLIILHCPFNGFDLFYFMSRVAVKRLLIHLQKSIFENVASEGSLYWKKYLIPIQIVFLV